MKSPTEGWEVVTASSECSQALVEPVEVVEQLDLGLLRCPPARRRG